MDDSKRQELLARRQKEQDEVLRLKGVNHGLQLELSQLVNFFVYSRCLKLMTVNFLEPLYKHNIWLKFLD